MGFLSRTFNASVRIILFGIAITFIPNIPPDMEFEAYTLTPTMSLKGPLALNKKLDGAEKLFLNKIKGPEHLEVHKNVLYTTLEGGFVAKIVNDDQVVPVVKFGQKCENFYDVDICGRTLGLSFDNKGVMYAADAYYGIFKVNVTTGDFEQLVSMSTEIKGKVPKLPNSLAVAQDGTIFWSDSSTTHSLHDGLYTILGNGNGRLIKYDPKTKSNTVLIDKLHFANGVALSKDESFVIVSDLFRARIMRYNLKGPNKGKSEVFMDGLPGFPDNLHSDGKGGFYVTLPFNVDESTPSVTALLGPYPLVRKLLARLLFLLELPATLLNSYYPNEYSKIYAHWVGSFTMVPKSLYNRITVIFFNEEGKITKSLHSTDGSISSISDIALYNNHYYLGSFSNNYLGRVKAS